MEDQSPPGLAVEKHLGASHGDRLITALNAAIRQAIRALAVLLALGVTYWSVASKART